MRSDTLFQPPYRSTTVGQPIALGERRVEIETDGNTTVGIGKAILRLHPSPVLVIETKLSGPTKNKMGLWSAGGSVSLRFGGSKKSRAQISSLSFRGEGKSLDVDAELRPNPQRLIFTNGKRLRLASMMFHIANFPSFLCSGNSSTDIRYRYKKANPS
jgi:hypothetical protein